MEEFTKKILKYESYLLNDFQLVNVHFDKKLLEKPFYLSKIDWALFKTIEDAQRIKEKYYSITNYYNYYQEFYLFFNIVFSIFLLFIILEN